MRTITLTNGQTLTVPSLTMRGVTSSAAAMLGIGDTVLVTMHRAKDGTIDPRWYVTIGTDMPNQWTAALDNNQQSIGASLGAIRRDWPTYRLDSDGTVVATNGPDRGAIVGRWAVAS